MDPGTLVLKIRGTFWQVFIWKENSHIKKNLRDVYKRQSFSGVNVSLPCWARSIITRKAYLPFVEIIVFPPVLITYYTGG